MSKEADKRYRDKYPERARAACRAYYWKNKEQINANRAKYAKNNLKDYCARTAKRRAIKAQATPKWLNKEHYIQIKLIYKNCPKGYHVDHIMPLNGIIVSGLHVPWNLQYLPAVENLKKGNRI
jgi:hypothetical protein